MKIPHLCREVNFTIHTLNTKAYYHLCMLCVHALYCHLMHMSSCMPCVIVIVHFGMMLG